MSDKGVIIKEACNALDSMLKKTKNTGSDDLESRDWWTK